jgi:hypothetical protein
VLCTWDLRTDNMVWRKTPGGPAEYECVIIDHQIWQYGGAPMCGAGLALPPV